MTDQLDSDGFVKVERFKYKPVNKKNNKKNKKHSFKDPDDWTMDDLTSTLQQRKEALVQSRFFKDLSVIFDQHLTPTKYHDMICYGIGSMQKSKNAQYQFELALILRDLLKIPGNVYIYDPVMTSLDHELCKAQNFKVIEENENGKRSIDQPTLFYMPHCGRGLYSNTLSANWNKQQLSWLTIIGNRFDMYVGSQLEKDLVRECPYLIPAVDALEVVSFPKEFDNNQIFNDLSIQTFPSDKLETLDASFWEHHHLQN